MPMPTNDDYEVVDKNQDDAIAQLVDAVVGPEVQRAPYSELVYEAAGKLVDAYNAFLRFLLERAPMTEPLIPTRNDYKLVNKNQDDAIAQLVDAVVGREVPRAPYGELVYKAAGKLVDACEALYAVYNYRLTDEEYEAEVERRRQIGLTIDPATAETTFWWADYANPYRLLDREKYDTGCVGRAEFARHPGASNTDWVSFGHLPKATRKALWERDEHKLTFPYGLYPDDDVINYPPAAKGECVEDVP
jgi:hypothetical protein